MQFSRGGGSALGSRPGRGGRFAAFPAPLANAMLAGVVLGLCLAPVRAVAAEPTLGLAVVAVWAVLAKFKRLYAVPAAVLAALILIAVTSPIPLSQMGPL